MQTHVGWVAVASERFRHLCSDCPLSFDPRVGNLLQVLGGPRRNTSTAHENGATNQACVAGAKGTPAH